VSEVDERKHSFRYKSTAIIFDKVAKVMNYLLLALTAYKAATQVIYGRLINGIIICNIFKPMFKPMFRTRKYNELNWSHQAVFNLHRSAANIFLIKNIGGVSRNQI